MKNLNFAIIALMFLSSCVFSTSKKNLVIDDDAIGKTGDEYQILGDSITVDTVIGDFRLFYRVTDIVDTSLVTFSCNEEASVDEIYTTDKTILLNVQRLDTTSVVAYKEIGIMDFKPVISRIAEDNYLIEQFYLKEVTKKSLIFGTKLCMFGKDICEEVDIIVNDDGSIVYTLLK